ncbi:unnamed protein product [Musa acuminata subsp. burmannicoides]
MRCSDDSGQRGTRINDLPEDILCSIVSQLPLQDRVTTSLVCRAWRRLWLSSSNWRLELQDFRGVSNKKQKFEELVDRVIFFPDRPHIHHLKLVHTDYNRSSQKASLWIESLLNQQILHLDLSIMDPIPLPLSLFRCDTLVELRLCLHCDFISLPPNAVLLPRLKVLSLQKARFIGDSLESLINGCTILVTLKLRECVVVGPEFLDITIPQTTLQEVILDKCHFLLDTKLHMSTVNLTTFRYKGLNLGDSMHYLNVQTSVEMVQLEPVEFHNVYSYSRRLGFSGTYGQNMSRTLASFCNTKHMILSDWCIEYLTNVPNAMRFPPFMRLESLRLSMWPNGGHVYVTTYLVLFSPLLRFLSLRISKAHREGMADDDRLDYPHPPDLLSTEMIHNNLKKVEIKKHGVLNAEFDLIKFLLRNAVSLEKLSIKWCARIGASRRKSLRNTIRSYPLASQNLELYIY